MEARGYVSEVFGSFQGEGPFVGERHVFVRLCRCSLGCAYCDTPGSAAPASHASFEQGPGGAEVLSENPVPVQSVVEAALMQEPYPGFNAALCVTGGEPLEQTEFLESLLKALEGRFKVLLETNGLHAKEFSRLSGLVDVVSMDVKLPSVSGLGPLWERHAAFIGACGGKELVVKAVVSASTPAKEVVRAAGLVASGAPGSLLVIQPLTGPDGRPSVDGARLFTLYREARGITGNVRVIPQVHKIMGVR